MPISSEEHKAFSLRPKLKVGEAGTKCDSWVKCDQPTNVEKNLVVYPPLGVLSPASRQKGEPAVEDALELKQRRSGRLNRDVIVLAAQLGIKCF